MNARSRLSRSSDFKKVYRQGSSVASRFLVLYYFKRSSEGDGEGPRMGLSVSKKLGGAVVRNRIKRLLREAFKGCRERLAPEFDYVVIARPRLLDLIEGDRKGAVTEALVELLERASLLGPAATPVPGDDVGPGPASGGSA